MATAPLNQKPFLPGLCVGVTTGLSRSKMAVEGGHGGAQGERQNRGALRQGATRSFCRPIRGGAVLTT